MSSALQCPLSLIQYTLQLDPTSPAAHPISLKLVIQHPLQPLPISYPAEDQLQPALYLWYGWYGPHEGAGGWGQSGIQQCQTIEIVNNDLPTMICPQSPAHDDLVYRLYTFWECQLTVSIWFSNNELHPVCQWYGYVSVYSSNLRMC